MPDDKDPAFAEDVFNTAHVVEEVLQRLTENPSVRLNALLMMVTTYGLHQIHEFGMPRQDYIDMVVGQINHLMDVAVIRRDTSTLN